MRGSGHGSPTRLDISNICSIGREIHAPQGRRRPDENDRYCTTEELIPRCDEVYRRTGKDHLELLAHFAALDDARVWRDDDCRDMAQWVAMSYGLPSFRARRMVAAGHAQKKLPAIAAALADGTLSLDKVLELCRFAAPEDERKLIRWAKRVSVAAVRDRADAACRIPQDEVQAAERARRLEWWNYADGMWGLYRLIHRHGWNVRLKEGVEPQWFRPTGRCS